MQDFHKYDDLVRFVYHDLNASEAMHTAEAIDRDLEMRLAFDEMLLSKLQLPKAHFNPSQATLNNILQYSISTAMEAHS